MFEQKREKKFKLNIKLFNLISLIYYTPIKLVIKTDPNSENNGYLNKMKFVYRKSCSSLFIPTKYNAIMKDTEWSNLFEETYSGKT